MPFYLNPPKEPPTPAPRRSAMVDRLDTIAGLMRQNHNVSKWEGDVHTSTTDRSISTTRDTVDVDGTFLTLQVKPDLAFDAAAYNDCYVKVTLEDSLNHNMGTLFRGYVNTGDEPFGTGGLVVKQGYKIRMDSWSYAQNINGGAALLRLTGSMIRGVQRAGGWTGTDQSNLEGEGKLRTISGTNPAAVASGNVGGEISETVTTGARWVLRAFTFNLAASATAANRDVQLSYSDGTNRFYITSDLGHQTASQGKDYAFGRLGESRVGTGNTDVRNTVIPDFILEGGYKIYTQTSGIKMGDNYGAPVYEVSDWIVV